jgi:signal transduction histidine kinase
MLSALKTLEKDALAEGYSALRATGEMTWYSTKKPGVEGLREYEARINEFYPKSTANILCQYDEQSFDSGVMLDVIRAHPKVVVHGELCVNPYYTPTGELLSYMHGAVPKGVFERTTTDILKRARLATIHELELRDSRRANKKMAVIGGTILQDLQSQISVVDFYAELAMDSVKDQATRGYLEKIAGNCATIQKRLDFMMSYQLVNQTEFRWWNLRDLFGSIRERSGANGIEMDLRVGNVRVWADGLFERALQTIVENVPDLKGRNDRLTVKSSELRSGMLISLEREGKGVSEPLKNRIFECGYRYGCSDGYGLFLASEILRSAGMTVRETGTPGRETRFEILVPYGKFAVE